MYIFFILFFISLLGIVIMIGKRIFALEKGGVVFEEKIFFEIPYIKNIKHGTIRSVKKYGHLSLVATIRLYVRSSNFLKNQYQETQNKIRSVSRNFMRNDSGESKETSKFLKVISEYKHKIREIKHKIHEEEKKL